MIDWRAAVLKRLARRFHIGEDVLRHLSTFQRLGELLEVEPPSEMLPVGARTIFRALRTRSAAQIRPDWLWPYWLERQLDPELPEFIPRGHLPFALNVTHRNWTAIGNPWSYWEPIVDPAGLVTPVPDGWSIDWWVRSSERWHLPSREDSLRQSLLDGAPIVETSISIPDGEAVQHAYVSEAGSSELAVVVVTNRSPHEVDVAFAVRPYNPEGLAVIEEVTLHEDRVLVDGDLGLLLPERPIADAISTYHEGDSLHRILAGGEAAGHPRSAEDPAGFAQAAALYRVPPGESVRVAAPIPPGPDRLEVRTLDRLPDAADVARRWDGILERGMAVDLPDDDLAEAVRANRAYMLLLHDPGDITAGPATYHRFWFRDAAYQLAALGRWGLHDEVVDVLRSYPRRQRGDGFFYSQWREWDANGAAIWAIAEHHRLTRDDQLLHELAPAVRKGVNWIERARHGRIRRVGFVRPDREVQGLLPAGISAEHLGPYDYYFWDDFWCLRGLVDGAYVAREVGDLRAAQRIGQAADEFREDILASIQRAVRRIGDDVIPAGPFRGVDAGMIGSLAACAPLGLLRPDDPLVSGTLRVLRDAFTIGPAFFQAIAHTGLGTYLTLQLAFVELERHDARAWERLRWLLDAATPTWTWPEAIHPQLPGGCMGDGHHGWAAADFLNFVRAVLVRETFDGDIEILGVLPEEWRGEELAVRDAPTHAGHLSYDVRWDGERPVLRWEWAAAGATLRAPGLDPSWSTTEQAGEEKLGDG